jgi:hypothetical protein|nr:MAG TPA: Protein of unknown function (DUF551) [Caudoviricetes sp.]
MEIRPIDANALQELCNRGIQNMWNTGVAPVSWAAAYADFKNDIDSIPTLTPPNEWISVEDRLPPNMDDVLVVVRDNGECWTATGYYSSMSKVWYAVLNGQDTQMDVLWWMPFPASPDSRPPEGEEGDANRG